MWTTEGSKACVNPGLSITEAKTTLVFIVLGRRVKK